MGETGGWFKRSEVATVRPSPATPPSPATATPSSPATADIFAGLPPIAREAFDAAGLEGRVAMLESEVRMLHRQLATVRSALQVIQEVPAVRDHVAGLFGLELAIPAGAREVAS